MSIISNMSNKTEIQKVFEDNKMNDLTRFIDKRQCLNSCNMYLIYLFHILQSAGILTTSVATGYNLKELIWIGVGLNILATLINIFEHTNNSISKHLLDNIISIKKGTYIDEGIIVAPEKTNGQSDDSMITMDFDNYGIKKHIQKAPVDNIV